MIGRSVVLGLAAAVVSTAVEAASFSCGGTLAPVEAMICHDPEVNVMDVDLSVAYKAALAASANPDGIKGAQRAWLKQRDACPDTACLNRAYTLRLDQLRADLAAAPEPASRTGTYKTTGGVLKIAQRGPGRFRFELSARSRDNEGLAEGEATLTGNTAVFEDEEDGCRLDFVFAKASVEVKQDGVCGMPAHVFAFGTYVIADRKTPTF
jgi:uncharacterized protein